MREYKVVTTPREDRLEQNVTAFLNEGWDVLGPPIMGNTGVYLQALVKETKETKDKKRASKIS
mgnify:CR=1 FL=1|jgi:hypothetical protein|tara:strand:+ start:672 stop:860 length:189 start_codon:yes stop_codon:yes gene_type:complete